MGSIPSAGTRPASAFNDVKRGVAQLGSAFALGAKGPRFESVYPDKTISPRSSEERALVSETKGPEFDSRRGYFASIAQSGHRATDFYSEGRRFESCWGHQIEACYERPYASK